MKKSKIRQLLIVMFICTLFFTACGIGNKKSGESTTKKAESSEVKEETTVAETTTKAAKKQLFKESEDLKIILSYTYDNSVFALVENVSDKIITDFAISYIQFDKNGLSIEDVKSGQFEKANMLPGKKLLGHWHGGAGKYVVARVKYVKYKDGSEWFADMLDKEFEEIEKNFSTDNHTKEIKKLKSNSKKAESSEYVKIVGDMKIKRNQFSDNSDFVFTLENVSEKTVKAVSLLVAQYDENGLPVGTSPYNDISFNTRSTGGVVNLLSGDIGTYSDNLFFEPSCDTFKVIVTRIVFEDEEEWENPYYYEWAYFTNKKLEE